MANYSRIDIEIFDYTVIETVPSQVLEISVHNTGGFFADMPVILNISPVSNQSAATLIADLFESQYGISGSELQLNFSIDVFEGDGGNWICRIEMQEYGWDYFEHGGEPSGINIYTLNEVQPPVLAIDDIVLSQAQNNNPATHVRHSITISNAVYPVELRYGNFTKTCANQGEVFFEYPRFTAGLPTSTPRTFDISNVFGEPQSVNGLIVNVAIFGIGSINIAPTLTGASISIIRQTISAGDVEPTILYQIEGIDNPLTTAPQVSNTFAVAPGLYTAYLIDAFGGISSSSFEVEAVTEIGKPDPYCKIESANSLKFYRVDGLEPFIDNAPISEQLYTNVEMRCITQPVNIASVITTQIKNTYNNLSFIAFNEANEAALIGNATKKVQNTSLLDYRDCNFLRSDDGLSTFIYFGGGKTYDPSTEAETGIYFDGGAPLPSFAQIGNYVELSGAVTGSFYVTGIIYDTRISRWVMVVDNLMATGDPQIGQCKSLYNIEDFDIWEFDTNFNLLTEGIYTIDVTATDDDPRYTPVLWRSEKINLKVDHKKHIKITYTHTSNINQIDYSTGIINQLIVPARFIKWRPTGQSERFNSDDNTIVPLKSIRNRVITLEAVNIPQYLAEKLDFAGGHDTVTINGISVKLKEDSEIEDMIDARSPYYKVTQQWQIDEGLIIGDSVGIVSEAASVLGVSNTNVLGV